MIAHWSMSKGLTMRGQHHGTPRIWVVKAWAKLPNGETEILTIKPKGKVQLADLVPMINEELVKFEQEKGVEATDAGFTATAR